MASDPLHGFKKASHGEFEEIAAKDELGISPSSLSLGYTHNDHRDMQRMGKNQELMASTDFHVVIGIPAYVHLANVSSFIDFQFHRHDSVHLGSCHHVGRRRNARQRDRVS